MVREKDKKEKEAVEQKQKRKEERELKRREKEKECERKKQEQNEKKQKRGRRKKRPYTNTDSNDSASSGGDNVTVSSAQLLANEGEDSDGSDTVCMICNAREPPVSEEIVFWGDCDCCGKWAYTYCAYESNMASRAFICDAC